MFSYQKLYYSSSLADKLSSRLFIRVTQTRDTTFRLIIESDRTQVWAINMRRTQQQRTYL